MSDFVQIGLWESGQKRGTDRRPDGQTEICTTISASRWPQIKKKQNCGPQWDSKPNFSPVINQGQKDKPTVKFELLNLKNASLVVRKNNQRMLYASPLNNSGGAESR